MNVGWVELAKPSKQFCWASFHAARAGAVRVRAVLQDRSLIQNRLSNETVEYRLLHRSSEKDITDLQNVVMGAPGYYFLVEGKSPGPEAAIEVLQGLPPGTSASDKYVFLVEHSGVPIGCVDVVRGYPNPEVAFIGLLLFVEIEQGKSHGVAALRYIERLADQWGCVRLRIAVVENNLRALAFWRREGFSELYRKPSDRFAGDVIVMERFLDNKIK